MPDGDQSAGALFLFSRGQLTVHEGSRRIGVCKLLNESHESLKDDYEVTGEYLDYIHEIALKYGALAERMTGAGFGGSSIAVIKPEEFEVFKNCVSKDYKEHFGFSPSIFLADICDGLIVKDIKK